MKQLYTRWGKELGEERILSEYPRPLLQRESYVNLNGRWEYAFTDEMAEPEYYDGQILVPFSPESALSGVKRQLMPGQYLWYRRQVQVEKAEGERILLHFGAVDQACKVWLNGVLVCRHVGGYLPFEADITKAAVEGENILTVAVQDYSDTSWHARGKQKLKRGGMFYTAQSGIWQTVWMEYVPREYIQEMKITPEYDQNVVCIQVQANVRTAVKISIAGEEPVEAFTLEEVRIPLKHRHPWTPETPYLYEFTVEMGEDLVKSYFALRKFTVGKDNHGITRLCLNGKPYYQKGVLDQGYWPDGLYTAPDDEAMIFDIQEMKNMGFNMIRKHIKIEPQRWYYHCDRLGMIVWQDMVNGGAPYKHWFVTYAATFLSRCRIRVPDGLSWLLSRRDRRGRREFMLEMEETIHRLSAHPCICTWVLFNEGWGQFDAKDMTALARKLDPDRLIDQASGWFDQGGGDIVSIHNYFFKLRIHREENRAAVLSEFGGFCMRVEEHSACRMVYGYRMFHSVKILNKAYRRLMESVVMPKVKDGLSGSVYTQLSDVEDEVNGVYTYDREVRKIDKA